MDSDLKYLLSLGVTRQDAAQRIGTTRIIDREESNENEEH